MCRCSYVRVSGAAAVVGCVVVLLCCCGVGAPLGLSVLVRWFPAAQHFAGPRGDAGGTYDWAMQSWASHSYRSATDTSLWRPSVSSLSAHSSARQQTWRRAGCSLSRLVSGLQIHHITEPETAEQVHVLPQGQHGHFCTPFSAKICADITIYHPPAHTMFGSLTFTWPCRDLLVLWCVNSVYRDARCLLYHVKDGKHLKWHLRFLFCHWRIELCGKMVFFVLFCFYN